MNNQFIVYLIYKKTQADLLREKEDPKYQSPMDVLRFTREGNKVAVLHEDHDNNTKFKIYLPRKRMSEYLRVLFQSFRADGTPSFKDVQVLPPGFPSIIVTVAALNDRGSVRDAIYEMADMVEESWFSFPMRLQDPVVPVGIAQMRTLSTASTLPIAS
jgi:hypothetical protein